jgi:cell wall-associated NlpC family hydrolase
MKTGLLVVLCLVFSFTGFTQTRKESKLYQLLEQENYPKLQKKAKKILAKNGQSAHANYAMAEYYVHKYSDTKSVAGRKTAVSKSLKHLQKIPVESRNEFTELSDAIYKLLKINAIDSSMKESINSQYRNWLLVYFNDSVPRFKGREIMAVEVATLDSAKIGDSLRFAMLSMAKRLEGVRYKYAGTSPSKGFDCSGFTQYVYKQVGIEIPHNAQLQSDLIENRVDLNSLKPGDLVFFGSWNGSKQRTVHAGIIYDKSGNDITVIHCVSGGVSIEGKDSSWDRYWIDKVLFGISMDKLASR